MRLLKCSLTKSNSAGVQCGPALFCINQEAFELSSKALWIAPNSSRIPRYCAAFIDYSRKNWPIISLEETAAPETFIFVGYRNESSTTWGFSVTKIASSACWQRNRGENTSTENHADNTEFPLIIHKLQHSIREIMACINGILTQGFLNLVREHVKAVMHKMVAWSFFGVQHEMQHGERKSGAAVG